MCSTCHVYLEPKVFDSLEEPSDDENDMLDLAFGLTEQCVPSQSAVLGRCFRSHYRSCFDAVQCLYIYVLTDLLPMPPLFVSILSSRLGCQVVVSKDLDGMRATLPPATRNMAVDGFVPQPH